MALFSLGLGHSGPGLPFSRFLGLDVPGQALEEDLSEFEHVGEDDRPPIAQGERHKHEHGGWVGAPGDVHPSPAGHKHKPAAAGPAAPLEKRIKNMFGMNGMGKRGQVSDGLGAVGNSLGQQKVGSHRKLLQLDGARSPAGEREEAAGSEHIPVEGKVGGAELGGGGRPGNKDNNAGHAQQQPQQQSQQAQNQAPAARAGDLPKDPVADLHSDIASSVKGAVSSVSNLFKDLEDGDISNLGISEQAARNMWDSLFSDGGDEEGGAPESRSKPNSTTDSLFEDPEDKAKLERDLYV